MEPLTKADCIRKVREHFSRPEAVLAYNEVIGCVYRGGLNKESPIRCAFGVLIPDEMYDPVMENRCASALYGGLQVMDPDGEVRGLDPLAPLFAAEVSDLWLDQLQAVHDDIAKATGHEGDSGDVAEFLNTLDLMISTGAL